MKPNLTWRGVFTVGFGGLALAWAGTAGLKMACSLAAGHVPGLTELLAPPVALSDLVFLPVLAMLLGIELFCKGWQASVLARLMRGGTISDRTDIFYILANSTGLTTVLGVVFTFGVVLGAGRAFGAIDGLHVTSNLPAWAQVAMLYVIGDFGEYWVHRFMHSRLMWPLHALHHAAENMSVLSGLRHHPFEDSIGDLPFMFAAAILGFSPEAIFCVGAIGTVHVILIHSTLQVPAWIERYLVCGTRLHTLHHSRDIRHHDTNFGLLVIWDRLFGTFLLEYTSKVRTGVDDTRFDTGRPMRDMWDATVMWARSLRDELQRLRRREQPYEPCKVEAEFI